MSPTGRGRAGHRWVFRNNPGSAHVMPVVPLPTVLERSNRNLTQFKDRVFKVKLLRREPQQLPEESSAGAQRTTYLASSKQVAALDRFKDVGRDVRLGGEVRLREGLLHLLHIHETQGPLLS